jgi:hypothetical protein
MAVLEERLEGAGVSFDRSLPTLVPQVRVSSVAYVLYVILSHSLKLEV